MNRALTILFFNLSIVPYLTFFLFYILPPGAAWLFRLFSIVILAGANLAFMRFFPLPARFPDKPAGFILPLALFAVGAALVGLRIYYEPHGWWDTWAMWNPRGRDYTGAFLEGLPFDLIRFTWTSYEYVTFYPLQLAFLGVFFGGWHVFIPAGLNLLYYGLVVGMLYACTSREDLALSRLVLLAGALLPYMINLVSDQCADLALGAYFAFGFYVYFSIRENGHTLEQGEISDAPRLSPALFAIFIVATLPLIKTEGLILAGCAAALWLCDSGRFPVRPAAIIGLIVPLVFYVGFKLEAGTFHHLVAGAQKNANLLTDLGRYRELVARFVEFHVVLVLGLPVVLFVSAVFRNSRALVFFLPPVLALVVYHAIFLVTPIEQGFHLDTAYVRITSQLYPAFFLLVLVARRAGVRAAGYS